VSTAGTAAAAGAAASLLVQAATAASMADSFNDTPAEGDGFTYEHFSNRQVSSDAFTVVGQMRGMLQVTVDYVLARDTHGYVTGL
jgi:hypothetical protein